jgi:hypothetical protein
MDVDELLDQESEGQPEEQEGDDQPKPDFLGESFEEPPSTDEPPKPERIMIAGIEVDSVGSIDPDRVAKVTQGRRKIPLQMMFRPGGTDSAQSAGIDHYIAVACYDVISGSSIKISNMIFTGSTEAVLTVTDPSEIPGGLAIDRMKGFCYLILNPVMTGPTSLRIDSLRACLRLGALRGLSTCTHEGCSKPVLTDRDGSLCYQHAVASGIRITTGGTSVTFDKTLSVEDEEKRKRERKAVAPSAEEKLAKERELKKQELIAKKKTALMLLNRNCGHSRAEVSARLSTGSLIDDLIDIGEVNFKQSAAEKEKVERLKELKRKREMFEKKEAKRHKEAIRKEHIAVKANIVLEQEKASKPPPGPRKSMAQQLADQIKNERAY